jgi:hypothetical protein
MRRSRSLPAPGVQVQPRPQVHQFLPEFEVALQPPRVQQPVHNRPADKAWGDADPYPRIAPTGPSLPGRHYEPTDEPELVEIALALARPRAKAISSLLFRGLGRLREFLRS